MDLHHWYKKDVVLDWQRHRLSFAVSQSLFSSHEVDAGSRLLLRSLDLDSIPVHGNAIDYGCGYGVLGLALQQVRPEWTIEFIDRDALAVAFTKWNAERLGWHENAGLRYRIGLGVESAPQEGVGLLLWNVPGKAGTHVLQQLAADAVDALAMDGLLALVIVNPLAAALRAVIAADETVSIDVDSRYADHTVILARRRQEPRARLHHLDPPFERGVFDRGMQAFGWGGFDYMMAPVVGLPEYDSRDHATECALDLVAGLQGPINATVVQGVGQGHIPVVIQGTLGSRSMVLVDRDLLALEASRRAQRDSGMVPGQVTIHARADLGPIWPHPGSVLLILMLPDQQSREVSAAQIRDMAAIAREGDDLKVIVAGGSTSVTRFLSLVKRHSDWRMTSRRKRHGASAAMLSVRDG